MWEVDLVASAFHSTWSIAVEQTEPLTVMKLVGVPRGSADLYSAREEPREEERGEGPVKRGPAGSRAVKVTHEKGDLWPELPSQSGDGPKRGALTRPRGGRAEVDRGDEATAEQGGYPGGG